jgi:sigma-B regulation protein RsbU (phosphoserine phosphatase)
MAEIVRQLALMGELQRHLLPRHIPELGGWRITGYYQVGRWPCGAYYDFLPLPDGRLLVLLADASEVGAPAVALTAMVRVVLHSCPLSSGVERVPFCPLQGAVLQPPHLLLGHLNEVLVENTLQEQFMTAFCGIVDPAEGNLHYANAGHAPPRWWRASARRLDTIRDAAGLPLGLQRPVSYRHKRIQLDRGDVLFLFSPGLTSLQDSDGTGFGSERLEAALRQSAPEGAEAVKAHLQVELDSFLNGNAPQDDVAFVVMERLL